MTITLTAEQEKFIAEQIEQGGFMSPSQAASEAFRLLQPKQERERRMEEWRREIEIGWGEAERGQLIDGPTAFKQVLYTSA